MTTTAEHVNRLTAEGRARAEKDLAALEAVYTRLLRAAGRAAAMSFQQQAVTAAVNPWEPPTGDLVDGEQLEQDAAKAVAPIHKRLLRVVSPASELGLSFDVQHASQQALLDGVAARLGQLGQAIREQVAESIRDGHDQGWSVARTAKAITEKVDAVTPGRAAMLARTDLNALSNGASVAAAREVGVETKTWVATEDERTRETHSDADGQTVPIDQPFSVGGEEAQYPGDPDLSDEESINCRCTVEYGEPVTAAATHAEGGDMDTTPNSGADGAADPERLWRWDPQTGTWANDGLTAAQLRELAARAEQQADELDRASIVLPEIELTAAADGGGTAWRATLLVEDEVTEDGRLLLPDSISWRQLPLTLGLMLETPHSDEGDAPACGRIDMIWRAGNAVQASGVFSDGSDDLVLRETGERAVAAVRDRIVKGISVDLVVLDGCEYFLPDDPGGFDPAGEDELPPEVGEDLAIIDGEPAEIVVELPAGRYVWAVREGVIGSACVVPFPAIAQATIDVVASSGKLEIVRATRPLFTEALTAAAVAPLKPPAEWFDDPQLAKPTPLTVTDDGRVFGHIALWNACHTGYQGRCVPPPRSLSGYRQFHVGEIELETGDRLPVGRITLKAGHAGTTGVTAEQARAHYDNSATVAAFVRAGEDRFGPWVAGALRSDLPAEVRRDLMANPPSGDWRNNEMIAVHAVPTPGFPVLRAAALDDDGQELETALIMASPFTDPPEAEPVGALAYIRPARAKAVA